MRQLAYISLCLLLVLVDCAPPSGEVIGVMDIRCVGLPAMQAWIQDHVEDEARRQSGMVVRSLPILGSSTSHSSCLRPVCMRQSGQIAQVDLVLAGSLERLADRLLIGWRIIDLSNEEADFFIVQDQPYHPERLEEMIRASLREFLATSWQGKRSEQELTEPWPIQTEHIE